MTTVPTSLVKVSPDPGGVRYAAWIDRHRVRILVIAFMVAAVAGAVASTLPIYGDLSYLLPPSAESVRHLRALEKRARVLGTVMIAVESSDPARRHAVAEELRAHVIALGPDVVSSVSFDEKAERQFAWEHRWLYVSLSDLTSAYQALDEKIHKAKLAANPLYVDFDEDKDGDTSTQGGDAADALRGRLKDAEAKRDDPGELVSKDGTLQMMIVRTPFSSGDSERGSDLIDSLHRIVAEVRATEPRVEVGLAGDVVSSLAEHSAILNGMLAATAITIVLVLAGLFLYFRTVVGLGALSWSLTVGTLLTFAFARAAIGHLNLATAFLSSIVVGNGINFGIILLARYMEERRGGQASQPALAIAISATFRGTLTAALTASVAYASLIVTDFRGFRHFGIIGGVGILFCWLSAYVVLPAGLAAVERRGLLRARREPALGRWLAHLLPKRPLIVVVGCMIVTAVAGVETWRYLAHDPYESNFRNLRSDSAAIAEEAHWMHEIDQGFGQGISGGFVIAVPSREETAPLLARLRALDEGKEKNQRLFSRLNSIDDALPEDQAQKLVVLGQIRGLLTPRALDTLTDAERADALGLRPPADLRLLSADDLPEEIAWPFIEADGSRGKMILAMSGWGYEIWNARDLVRFAGNVRALSLGPNTLLGGTAFVLADVLRSLQTDGPLATLVAVLGAVLVVAFVVGFRRHGVVTLVCGACGTLIMLATGAFLGLRVNFLDFVALPITIGIGIDYSVNICVRERQDGPGSARTALATAGAAVFLCSFTTIVGYGSLLLSTNKGIRSFGSAAILGEATCLLAALALAPALLSVLARRPAARS